MPMLTRDVLIHSAPLRHGEELRVMLSPYRGQTYLHCRRWFLDGDVWKPGKGLAVRIDCLPWLLETLRTTGETAAGEGLLLREDFENAGVALRPEFAEWFAR